MLAMEVRAAGWLLGALTWGQDLLRWTTDRAFALCYGSRANVLPPITDPILLHSASALADKIRSGQLKSEDAALAYISRIKSVNGLLNAVVDERFEEAVQEARTLDRRLLAMTECQRATLASRRPLYGVPVTVKENFQVKGLRQTAGLVDRQRAAVSDEDAESVRRLRDAGAVVLGVTNLSELCTWWESRNNVYGQTNNPYDLTRTAGGSSGGEGSAVGSAASVVGIGSDIGGSIRLPAFFGGVFGHKCSSGVTRNDGQLPKVEGERQEFLATGPLCRYACDLSLVLRVLTADDARLELDVPVDVERLRVFYMKDDGGFPLTGTVSADLMDAQSKVVRYLERARRATVTEVCFPEMARSLELWTGEMSGSGYPSFCEELTQRKGKLNVYAETAKWALGRSKHTLPALAVGLLERCEKSKTDGEKKEMEEVRRKLRDDIVGVLGGDGVLLYPSFPVVAPYHGQPLLTPCDFGYQAVFNVLGLPVTQCPLGLSFKERLPLGIQIVASPYKDRLTMAVAMELERAFGGWVPPCDVRCDVH